MTKKKYRGLLTGMLFLAAVGLCACAEKKPEEGNGAEQTGSVTKPESTEQTGSVTEPESTGQTGSVTEPENTEQAESLPDVTPPVLTGVQDLAVELGGSVSYKKGVTATDDSGDCTLEIDTTSVNLYETGTYEVVYTATDGAGNTTSKTITVTVYEPPEITQEQVDQLADELIASLVTEDMTQMEKAKALWNWCRTKITYSYSAGERNVTAGAYAGLHDRKGDCYVYYATYEVLLNRLGIENMCVTRVGGSSNHWWNLVNLGDGWYHCDASPRHQGHKFRCFMQTDEQIAAYEAAYTELYPEHPNYYTFDPELYPERATEIIVESKIP